MWSSSTRPRASPVNSCRGRRPTTSTPPSSGLFDLGSSVGSLRWTSWPRSLGDVRSVDCRIKSSSPSDRSVSRTPCGNAAGQTLPTRRGVPQLWLSELSGGVPGAIDGVLQSPESRAHADERTGGFRRFRVPVMTQERNCQDLWIECGRPAASARRRPIETARTWRSRHAACGG